jgi:ribonuclease Y
MRREAEEDVRVRREETRRREGRLAKREESAEAKGAEVDRAARALAEKSEKLDRMRDELARAQQEERLHLEQVARMTTQEAKDSLIAQLTDQAKREAMGTVREIEQRAREEAEARARKIVTIAIQRVASEQTAESTVSVFTLPSDDLKGRIIGREGRNIRAFEALTGVNLIIDDTPEAVVLSSFDPVRREVARLTLDKLVQDGRIQPARIEEMFERSSREVEEQVKRSGEWAIGEVGITEIHPEMVRVMGRLQYRSSYGQNVLKHLVESAHIAGAMAAELGIDPELPKRAALMHDIGKALTHEVEGSHALIGAELARRLKESPEVIHAIESHHGEVEQRTVEAVLAQAADAISGSRPGARRESIESYVKRLQRLEEICESHPGVAKVFAMQAGREVRVMVQPEEVDDLAAQVMARDIAKQVEEELQYPGQIKITVVRETRAVEVAK